MKCEQADLRKKVRRVDLACLVSGRKSSLLVPIFVATLSQSAELSSITAHSASELCQSGTTLGTRLSTQDLPAHSRQHLAGFPRRDCSPSASNPRQCFYSDFNDAARLTPQQAGHCTDDCNDL